MLKQLQALSGIVFFAFLVLHLGNTFLGAFGPELYDRVQQGLRVVYQFAPLEALLLAAIAVHVVVGLMRIKLEPKRSLTTRARWHRYAGIFLAVVIVGHVLAVRGSSWFYDVYPGFVGLAWSVAYVPEYFYPYYFLLGVAGFYHGMNGIGIATQRVFNLRLTASSRTLGTLSGAAAVAMLFTLLALGGITADVGAPHTSAFAELAARLTGFEVTP